MRAQMRSAPTSAGRTRHPHDRRDQLTTDPDDHALVGVSVGTWTPVLLTRPPSVPAAEVPC